MSIVINASTGLAEDLPEHEALSALTAGTHHVALTTPEGDFSTAPLEDAKQLLQQGYQQPHPEQLKNLLDTAKYSSTPEQIKTFLEGAAQGSTFGGSTAVERLFGVNPESIQTRQEVNPGVHELGEAAGVGVSSLAGVGEGALLGKAGQLTAKALGLSVPEKLIAQVGSEVAQNAVQTALVSSGDEVSKMLASDPNQSAESAMANIGLNALLGGGLGAAFGSVSPLWQAAKGTKVGQFLSVIKDKANGVEKDILPKVAITQDLENAGIEVSPLIKSGLSENPEARSLFSELQESLSRPGKEAQQSLQDFKKKASDSVLRSIGKTPQEVDSLYGLSDHKVGSELKDSLVSEIESRTKPLSNRFEEINQKYSKEPVTSEDIANLSNQLGEINLKYSVSPSSSEFKKINNIIEELKNVKTLSELKDFQSVHLGDIANKQLWNISSPVKNAFRSTEENLVSKKLGQEAPELLGQHQEARSAYRNEMQTIDDLNERLRVGNDSTPTQFLYNLKNMNPEKILDRLTKTNDAGLLTLMQEKFPQTLQKIKESFINQALEKSSSKAAVGESINPKTLFNVMDSWSPELRDFVLSKDAQKQIGSVRNLLESLPERVNPSGSGKIINDTWSKMTGGVVGLTSLLTGHSPLASYILGNLSKHLGTTIPDSIKLATLKFLGSDLPVNSSAFKSLAEFVSHSMEAERMTNRAIGTLFKSGIEVAPQMFEPHPKNREKLKRKLAELKNDPSALMQTGGDTSYYLPDHAASFGSIAARAVDYLNSLKPNTSPPGLLDEPREPSKIEEQNYNRALDIAEQPLSVISHIHSNTLLPQDVIALKTIYPSFYNRLSQKITNQLIDSQSKGKTIPYDKRLGLSIFLAQPLDSTMTQSAIQSTQMLSSNSPQVPQNQTPPQKGAHSLASLNPISGLYSTPNQSRETQKLTQRA